MGSISAAGFAGAVEEGQLSLASAISWHLSSNHYPPVPAAFGKTCLAAIGAAQNDDWDLDIPLPKGCNTHRRLIDYDSDCEGEGCDVVQAVDWKDGRPVATASALVESFHLDSFL